MENIAPIVMAMLDRPELEVLKEQKKIARVFDQAYCSSMYDDKYYRALSENKWDTYRDLNKIFKDEFSKERGLD